MDIVLRDPQDAAELTRRIREARDAKQRDRFRSVQLAIAKHSTKTIMAMLDRSRGFVQRWCYTYRDHGLDAIGPRKPPGRPTRLPSAQHSAFKQRVIDGPTEADGVCALRGADCQRILEEEFGVRYSLNGVYELLHRLNLSVLVPRPQHRKSDPEAQAQWVDDAPQFVREVQAKHPEREVQVWFQDEARVGQQGTLTRVWAERGSSPRAVRQTEFQWGYIFGAVNPITGASSALISPTVNTTLMSAHLRMIAEEAGEGVHVVLVLDGAGWHKAKDLLVPETMTLFFLPPYAPELMPMERVWQWMREHDLSNRVFADEAAIDAACKQSWNNLTPQRLQSITATSWLTHVT